MPRYLAWIFKVDENINSILDEYKNKEEEFKEYLKTSLIPRNKLTDKKTNTFINICDFSNYHELKEIMTYLESKFSSTPIDKQTKYGFNKYVHTYALNLTTQLHIHIFEKTQYYYEPRLSLETINTLSLENSMNIDRIYEYYSQDPDYMEKFKNNNRILFQEKVALTLLT